MIQLNLPTPDIRLKNEGDKTYVYDIIRKKYIWLSPEEWVRQHFIHFLINKYQYPSGLISVESGLKYNQLNKRSDIVVYDTTGNPFLLIECKSADIKISQATFNQAATYNQTLKAPYLAVSNGLKHYICHIDFKTGNYSFLKDFPAFHL